MRRGRGFWTGVGAVLALSCGGRGDAGDAPPQEDTKNAQRPAAPTEALMFEQPQVRPFTPTPVEARAVEISPQPLRTGDVRIETYETAVRLLVDVASSEETKTLEIVDRRSSVARLEVLDHADTGPTRARLTYERRLDERLQNGASTPSMQKPVEGRTYVLGRADDKTSVAYDDGSAPPTPEANAVLEAMTWFGGLEPFSEVLPSGKIEPGHRIELDERRVAALLEARPRRGQALERGTLTYRGIAGIDDRPLAVFELDAVLEQVDGILQLDKSLRGEILADPQTGRLVRATIQGPVAVGGEVTAHGGFKMNGSGALVLDVTATYERPPAAR